MAGESPVRATAEALNELAGAYASREFGFRGLGLIGFRV